MSENDLAEPGVPAHDYREVIAFSGKSRRTTLARCTVCGMLRRDVVALASGTRTASFMRLGTDVWHKLDWTCGR